MSLTVKTYRSWALVLWCAVWGVAGWSIGYSWDWKGRKLVFAVIVAMGIYGLLLLQRTKSNSREDRANKARGVKRDERENIDWLNQREKTLTAARDRSNDDEGRWLAQNDQELRQRLDDFLLIQQNK